MKKITQVHDKDNLVCALGTPSFHGLHRTMERLNCREDQAYRFIRNAYERGTVITALPFAKQRQYLELRGERYGQQEYRVYKDCLWVYSPAPESVLITVFPVPDYFSKRSHYVGKDRIRDFKRYAQEKRSEHDFEYAS